MHKADQRTIVVERQLHTLVARVDQGQIDTNALVLPWPTAAIAYCWALPLSSPSGPSDLHHQLMESYITCLFMC